MLQNMIDSRPFDLDRTVRLCITIAVILILFALTRQLSGVLLPFVVSWFLAYLIHPIVNFFQYKCRLKNRTLSVAVALIVIIGVLAALIALLIDPVRQQVIKTSSLITEYVSGLSSASFIPEGWQDSLRQWMDKADLEQVISADNISKAIEKITPYITGLVGGSISFISSLFVIFVGLLYLIFILIDYEQLSAGLITAIPPKHRELVGGILNDLESGMNKYFRGQALIASCVGVLFAIGFSITGLPLGILVGLFIGVLNMVPYLQAVGIPVCMVLGLLQSADTGTAYWIILIEIAAVFIIVQSIQDLLLTPYIMGNVIGMKPAVMLLSLSIWGSLFGVAGMIIALPLTTVIISYYKRLVLGQEPQEPLPTEKTQVPADK